MRKTVNQQLDNAPTTRPQRTRLVLFGALGLAGVVGLVMVGVPSGARGAAGFNVTSLGGGYGFVGRATVLPGALPGLTAAAPGVSRGRITFDRGGGCTFAESFNVGGGAGALTSTACTYTVSSDGTGTIAAVFGGVPGTSNYQFVIVNNRKGLYMIKAGLVVASFEVTRQ